MKFEQVKSWKMAGKVAAVVALGAVAAAQSARGEGALDAREGQALTQVSMENDLRTPEPARGKIILQRPDQGQLPLELVLKMRHRTGAALDALMPSIDEMETTLVLANGTPGGMAVIHLDTRAPEVRRASGTRIVGFFDEDGQFAEVLPLGFQVRGIFAHGEEVTWYGLHRKAAAAGGGRAVPSSRRPVTEDMDVEQVVNQAYAGWARLYAETYTRLQFGGGHRMSSASLDQGAEEIVLVDDPIGARRAGAKIVLQRPSRTPALGGGHVQAGSSVENDAELGEVPQEVIVDLPRPVGGGRGGTKIVLQRPDQPRPVITLPHVDEPIDVADLADPQGGRRAGGKITLHRTPARRDGHVLQRKL